MRLSSSAIIANGIRERLNKTVLNQFYRVGLPHRSIDELQADLVCGGWMGMFAHRGHRLRQARA
jgi:hypothetical protein